MRKRPRLSRARATTIRIAVLALLGLLAGVLFRYQVVASEAWLLEAQSNRLRTLAVPAPRGVIRDRAGRDQPVRGQAKALGQMADHNRGPRTYPPNPP